VLIIFIKIIKRSSNLAVIFLFYFIFNLMTQDEIYHIEFWKLFLFLDFDYYFWVTVTSKFILSYKWVSYLLLFITDEFQYKNDYNDVICFSRKTCLLILLNIYKIWCFFYSDFVDILPVSSLLWFQILKRRSKSILLLITQYLKICQKSSKLRSISAHKLKRHN
jgi:hypothetical protein